MSRLERAVDSVRRAIATAADIPFDGVGPDEDIVDDIGLDPLECESLALIVEEVFGVTVPDELWRTPLHRTAAALAEWAIRESDHQAWLSSRRSRRHA